MIEELATCIADHRNGSAAYEKLAAAARANAQRCFGPSAHMPQRFEPFGSIHLPYYEMGAITSVHLFGIDELIIFAFYWANRHRYKRVADLGANIGLHTLVLDRCGFQVQSFEPDPETFEVLKQTQSSNDLANVSLINAAVSRADGRAEFTRVMGNRTGSHLSGAKPDPYGELETFSVDIKAFGPIARWADLMKIDVEGHEKELMLSTDRNFWAGVDAIMEVGTAENAAAIHAHLDAQGLKMFAQKIAWGRVSSLDDLPTSHREGSLFVTLKDAMPWG